MEKLKRKIKLLKNPKQNQENEGYFFFKKKTKIIDLKIKLKTN
jgi:predicted transport protein